MKMIVKPLRLIRLRQLELKSYCPTKKKTLREKITSNSNLSCPSCFLPLVVFFIFIFTVSQLIVIHRTIEAYKLRHQAYEDCYFPVNGGGSGGSNDSRTVLDLAFLQNFVSEWRDDNKKNESKGNSFQFTDQTYPYNLHNNPRSHYLNILNNWKPTCSTNPPHLIGNISVDLHQEIELETLIRQNLQVTRGGWAPNHCNANTKIAIIIPFRERWKHLKTLLSVLHPMIRRQQLKYQFFVVEQYGNYTFNKGILMNAAFLLAVNDPENSFDCIIFHDVDLIPEDDRNLYTCASKQPRHLSVAWRNAGSLEYRIAYSSLVGGVFSVRVEDFIQLNGYSNLFFGYGGEDDDMASRISASHLLISRPKPAVARFLMLSHGKRPVNEFIAPLIRTSKIRYRSDGLTSCRFRLVRKSFQPLFTHFVIDVGLPKYVVQNKTLKSIQQN